MKKKEQTFLRARTQGYELIETASVQLNNFTEVLWELDLGMFSCEVRQLPCEHQAEFLEKAGCQ